MDRLIETGAGILITGLAVIGIAYKVAVLKIVVQEGHAALLYRHGRFRRKLAAGAHRVLRWGARWDIFDLRLRTTLVPGQEVVTADGVGLKISLSVVHAIEDPERAAHRVQSHAEALYSKVQLALRGVIAEMKIDELIAGRAAVGRRLLEQAGPETLEFGVKISSVAVRDLMFAGEMKKVFAEEVKARKEGLAALERARAEAATLRSLANSSRVLEGNPALMNLRMLQAMGANGTTLVMGLPQGIVPLAQKAARPVTDEPDVKES